MAVYQVGRVGRVGREMGGVIQRVANFRMAEYYLFGVFMIKKLMMPVLIVFRTVEYAVLALLFVVLIGAPHVFLQKIKRQHVFAKTSHAGSFLCLKKL